MQRGSGRFHPPHSSGCMLNQCHGIFSYTSGSPLCCSHHCLYLSSFFCFHSSGFIGPHVQDRTRGYLRSSLFSSWFCFVFCPSIIIDTFPHGSQSYLKKQLLFIEKLFFFFFFLKYRYSSSICVCSLVPFLFYIYMKVTGKVQYLNPR